MAQGLNSTKSAARPSHEAIEDETAADESNKSDQERMGACRDAECEARAEPDCVERRDDAGKLCVFEVEECWR